MALKLLAPALAADPAFVELASLNHVNVVVVYDHGVADGQPYIAMEYVPGRTLKAIISSNARLPPAEATAYALQALAGLGAAHELGIVHRDVKPHNLIVRDDGALKVVDFGVARSAEETVLTQHGSVIGTADYISPEQARGEPATVASDLYSVGIVLYEMLTGTLPFRGELPLAVANQHAFAPAPALGDVNPTVPAALAHVVGRAMSKDPARRYPTAAAMRSALEPPSAPDAGSTRVAPTARLDSVGASTKVFPNPPGSARYFPSMLRRGALVAGLAVAALCIAAAFALITRGGSEHAKLVPRVQLPRVVGTPLAAAVSALRARGIITSIAPAVHASQPPGTVQSVRPNVTAARRGATVTLVPSSGPSRIAIPAVAGLSQAAATTALQHAGLVVHPRSASASTPSGTAVSTEPAAGMAVPLQSAVVLTISSGPAPVAPPASASPPGKAKGKGHGKAKGHDKKKHKGEPRSSHP